MRALQRDKWRILQIPSGRQTHYKRKNDTRKNSDSALKTDFYQKHRYFLRMIDHFY